MLFRIIVLFFCFHFSCINVDIPYQLNNAFKGYKSWSHCHNFISALQLSWRMVCVGEKLLNMSIKWSFTWSQQSLKLLSIFYYFTNASNLCGYFLWFCSFFFLARPPHSYFKMQVLFACWQQIPSTSFPFCSFWTFIFWASNFFVGLKFQFQRKSMSFFGWFFFFCLNWWREMSSHWMHTVHCCQFDSNFILISCFFFLRT